jgi:hypothetical protein
MAAWALGIAALGIVIGLVWLDQGPSSEPPA